MNLNVINNFKAMYYNTLTNFYLYFNTFVPYYDDVILTLSITSFKNIIKSSKIKLKENRLLQLIYSLDDKDNIVVDDDGFIFVDYYIKEAVEAVAADADNVIHDEVAADTEAVEAVATDTEAVETDTEADAADTECYNSIEKKNN